MPVAFRDRSQVPPLPPIPRHLRWLRSGLRLLLTNVVTDPLSRLRWIYRYLNVYNRFVATFAVCQRGCSHCCSIDVHMTELEAMYISQANGVGYSRKAIATGGHTSPCPFLGANGECTIYDSRPLNCRTFHTLDDPKYCATPDVDHVVYGVASRGYGSRILAELAWAVTENNQAGQKKDIRDFFSEVPTSGR